MRTVSFLQKSCPARIVCRALLLSYPPRERQSLKTIVVEGPCPSYLHRPVTGSQVPPTFTAQRACNRPQRPPLDGLCFGGCVAFACPVQTGWFCPHQSVPGLPFNFCTHCLQAEMVGFSAQGRQSAASALGTLNAIAIKMATSIATKRD